MPNVTYRAGDVLRISCPFATTFVSRVGEYDVIIRWPWWEIDPDSDFIRWNGEVALSLRDPGELYTTEPPVGNLVSGQICRVGLPPRIVHVLEVQEYDPPQVSGWLPRSSLELLVLTAGEAPDPRAEFQGTAIEVDGGVPITYEMVFRPYAFLELGDDVADSDQRAWRFGGPFAWTAFDGGSGAPAWPLTLLDGDADADVVASVTAAGEHADEIARWRREAGLGN
ncbi:hypothetical protein L3i22_071810 [Actinoplanes sp. L3-i22]|nr:hypothetical protein L3i22_071810 [Actinoplanes sp. L3-i22]